MNLPSIRFVEKPRRGVYIEDVFCAPMPGESKDEFRARIMTAMGVGPEPHNQPHPSGLNRAQRRRMGLK